MWGFKETILLKAGNEGVVRLGEDTVTKRNCYRCLFKKKCTQESKTEKKY